MTGGLEARGDSAGPSSSAQEHLPDEDGAAGAPLQDAPLQEVLAGYLAKAEQHRSDMGDKQASVEHLVLALAEDPRFGEVLGCTTGFQHHSGGPRGRAPTAAAVAAPRRAAAGLAGLVPARREEDLKVAIKKSRVIYNRGQEYDQPFEMSVLAKYSRDLTEMARAGKLDPVIGRADEMRRLIDVLCRRTKNSAVLLGEAVSWRARLAAGGGGARGAAPERASAGERAERMAAAPALTSTPAALNMSRLRVGKTAIVEGLAQRIAQDDVPEGLRGSRVIALEMGLLMAGAAFPGEFEERLRGVLKELQQEGLRAILFIDDIHTITGPNAQQGGGVNDASVMLKPLLSRGEVRCLGCTSLDKYRKFIEKDPGLERRFQQVPVEPPTVVETISILRGLRHKYEAHHGVRITDAALAAAAHLGDRYLPDRFLPDKAIDLVDEAAAKVKTDLALRPEALDRIERRIKWV
ncbi:Chaperone protein clpB 1 [Monoraphidium neglectum]|uniref:Chaperone protein clpB 1 n=1 Tax=Monoraphidium neglectum TaxID=145388 RepID=A0A0D2M702_9CHLO|nr:Chaperone protein clpB 1 [Monoraphidium neglectum]KIY96991.1 Chaperone protein clpB 1 [Monoraphidium neglectum]|eukprot:XP_013896011.1 Chaperone protein clpB 1 [Monoraphidium neglectum]